MANGGGMGMKRIAALALAGFFMSAPQALAGNLTLADCTASGGFSPESISGPIVYCIEKTVRDSVTGALFALSDYFKGAVAAMLILAVTMHGARMLSGERGINAKSLGVMLKIVFVAFFAYNLGGFAESVFNIMDELLGYSVNGYSPWGMIDSILGTIFGFAPGVALFQGLMWLVTGFASGTTSAGMSATLVVAFIELILFVIEIIYTFLIAYIIVGFMLILSPMFIPMLLFQVSERYFKKWLDTIIGAMLIPVFLFGLLSLSLGVYTKLIGNVFTTILPGYNFTLPLDPANPPDFKAFWHTNEPVRSYTMGLDPNFSNDLNKALSAGPRNLKNSPPAHTTVDPFDRGGFQPLGFNPPTVNFGAQDKSVAQQLIYTLIALWLYTAVLKELIRQMPGLAQEIAGSYSGIALHSPKLNEKMNEIKSDAAGAVGTLGGGVLGGQIAAASGSKRMTQAGTIGGGIIGHVLARKAV